MKRFHSRANFSTVLVMFGFCDPCIDLLPFFFSVFSSGFHVYATLIPFLKFHASHREQLSPFTLVYCVCDSMLLVKCVLSLNY